MKKKKWFGHDLRASSQLVFIPNHQGLLQHGGPRSGRLVNIAFVETLGDISLYKKNKDELKTLTKNGVGLEDPKMRK